MTQFFRPGNHKRNTQKSEEKKNHKKYNHEKNDEKFNIYFEGKGKKGIVNVKLPVKYPLPCTETFVYPIHKPQILYNKQRYTPDNRSIW